MKTQFVHIITTEGGVTLALRKDAYAQNALRYRIGAAFCSPTETHFNRKKGRLIAEGRLNAQRHGYVVYTRNDDEKPLSLAESPLEVLNLLRYLHTKQYGQTGTLGPAWWINFITAARRKFDYSGARSLKKL